jgi:hypothetical protein
LYKPISCREDAAAICIRIAMKTIRINGIEQTVNCAAGILIKPYKNGKRPANRIFFSNSGL